MTLVVVPLGSWEQHGPHLPSDTDSVIISAVVAAAVADRPDVTVAPTLHVTASDEHAGFAGTLSIGTEAMAAAIVAIARSASWASGVLFANGHGGNAGALAVAREAMDHEGLVHDEWSLPPYDGSDLHAGRTETSVMLHLAPASVDMSRAVAGAAGTAQDLISTMRADGVRAVSGTGVLGDPTKATAGHGKAVFAMWVGSLSRRIDRLADEWGRA